MRVVHLSLGIFPLTLCLSFSPFPPLTLSLFDWPLFHRQHTIHFLNYFQASFWLFILSIIDEIDGCFPDFDSRITQPIFLPYWKQNAQLRQRESEEDMVGGWGVAKQNFPGAAACELLGSVSGLIKWRSSLLRKLVLTELEQSGKGVTSVFLMALSCFPLCVL